MSRKIKSASSRPIINSYKRPEAGSSYNPVSASRYNPEKKPKIIPIITTMTIVLVVAIALFFVFFFKGNTAQPDELLNNYFSLVKEKDYASLYSSLTERAQSTISHEDFVARNENVYSGIEANNINLTIHEVSDLEPSDGLFGLMGSDEKVVSYSVKMDTIAGQVAFDGEALYRMNGDNEYRLEWSPDLILSDLWWTDMVRVNTISATRGNILDRNGQMLAGEGTASSVGFVPAAMDKSVEKTDEESGEHTVLYNEDDIAKAADILGITTESILQKLNASYVQEDSFVLLKTLSQSEESQIDELLTISGIMVSDTPVRSYPLAEKASHLTGYVQGISAEELEVLQNEGYNEHSVIGKAGLEKLYEDQLRAIDGCEIVILDKEDHEKATVAKIDKVDGQDITLTIDTGRQVELYDLFSEDKSCSVAMNPKTGEILALVSTPTYDANDFVTGMSGEQWASLNDDKNLPMYNRFKATLCPGSTMKPITAAIGLDTGTISANDDFGSSGLVWQKDASWGDYYITTTMEYSGAANVENALKFSDNIFFAKTALAAGSDLFYKELKSVGFEEDIPFEFGLYSSLISSGETFESEIQLADSGYGQGHIQVNPVHMATLYASFINDGDVLQPYLIKREDATPSIWIEDAFSPTTAQTIKDDLIQVIESGSSADAQVYGRLLAGKTGTAEIKQTVDDTSGTELGWFAVFTASEDDPDPLLIVSMVEDVKNRGGSHYVSVRVKSLFQ